MARRHSDAMTVISLTGFTALSAGLLLIFSSSLLLQAQGGASGGGGESYLPVPRVVYGPSISPAAMTEAAAPYEPFKVCRKCRCCTTPTNPSTCVDMSCCFGIDCNLPGKPFGTCAFLPKVCGCDNCTQPAS